MKKKIVEDMLIGMGISLIITSIYNVFFIESMTNIQVYQEYVLWGIFGALMGAYYSIYRFEKGSLLFRSFVHLLLSDVTYLITIYVMNKWIFNMEMNIASILFVGVTFIAIYFVIWLIMYKIEKKRVEALNEKFK